MQARYLRTCPVPSDKRTAGDAFDPRVRGRSRQVQGRRHRRPAPCRWASCRTPPGIPLLMPGAERRRRAQARSSSTSRPCQAFEPPVPRLRARPPRRRARRRRLCHLRCELRGGAVAKRPKRGGGGKAKVVTLGASGWGMIEVTAVRASAKLPSMAEEGWSMIGWYIPGPWFLPSRSHWSAPSWLPGCPKGGASTPGSVRPSGERSGFISI